MRRSTLLGQARGYVRELVLADDKHGLKGLEAERVGGDEAEGLAVEADQALALTSVGDSRRSLLLTEARNERRSTLRFRHLWSAYGRRQRTLM